MGGGFQYQVGAQEIPGEVLLVQKVTLTGAQILNPLTWPFLAIPSPGPGYAHNVISVDSRIVNGSIVFGGGSVITVGYVALNHLFNNSTNQFTATDTFKKWAQSSVAATSSMAVNQDLYLLLLAGPPFAGNGTLEVWIYYTIQAMT